MEMRDGVLLRADIYRPDDRQEHSAIFSRAYHKGFGNDNMHLSVMHAVRAGYAVVVQVVRGRGTSGGEWKPENAETVEAADGYDSVEWIASQRWCDGSVGVMGYSHSGGMAAQIAMENPPHLKAIAPWSSGIPPSRGRVGPGGYRPPNSGGAISLITALVWLPNEAGDIVRRLARQGEDVIEMWRALEWARQSPEEYFNYLPLLEIPFVRFEQIGRLWKYRLQGLPGAEATSAKAGDRETYGKVKVPCSHLTGWFDGLASFSFESFQNMRQQGGSKLARQGQHIICGPWAHSLDLPSHLGAVNFGAEVGGTFGGVTPSASSQLLTFFDKYLRDKDVRIPPVRYFLMGVNQWREADAWPLPQTEWQRYYLHSRGRANTSIGDGRLTREEPGAESPDTFVYDPHNPVPTVGGSLVAAPAGFGFVAGPLEQSHLETRPDVLCYTTPELKQDLEITGPLEVHIFASTTAKDTDFTAKLVDVYPDGRSHNLLDGIKRARGLKSEDRVEFINPGEVYEFVITLGPTSQLFRRGHRLRIDISSSNFPLYDRNMNTGNPIGEDARGVPATQTVYHQKEYASYIDLPVIPG